MAWLGNHGMWPDTVQHEMGKILLRFRKASYGSVRRGVHQISMVYTRRIVIEEAVRRAFQSLESRLGVIFYKEAGAQKENERALEPNGAKS